MNGKRVGNLWGNYHETLSSVNLRPGKSSAFDVLHVLVMLNQHLHFKGIFVADSKKKKKSIPIENE